MEEAKSLVCTGVQAVKIRKMEEGACGYTVRETNEIGQSSLFGV
jgi:hypothetical protein